MTLPGGGSAHLNGGTGEGPQHPPVRTRPILSREDPRSHGQHLSSARAPPLFLELQVS